MSVKMKPVDTIIMDFGLEDKGDGHEFFANSCRNRMNARYVPVDSGVLRDTSYVDEDCNIVYNQPYARYQYYGKLMVMDNGKGAYYNPKTKRFWSAKGKKKHLTDIDLNYKKAGTGPYWNQLMTSAESDELVKEMEAWIKKRGNK